MALRLVRAVVAHRKTTRHFKHFSLSEIQRQPEAERGPLFSSVFTFQRWELIGKLQQIKLEEVQSLTCTIHDKPVAPANVKVSLGQVIHLSVFCDAACLAPTAVESLVCSVMLALQEMSKGTVSAVGDIGVISAEDTQRVVFDWSQTVRESPTDAPIHQLFEARVRSQPEAIAAVCGEEAVSYAALDPSANRIASALLKLGVAPGQFVGVC